MLLKIEEFRTGKLVIYCPEIVVTQETSDNPKVYKGPGRIFQTPERKLAFELFHHGDRPSIKYLFELSIGSNFPPGKLIPRTERYSLMATDLAGGNWLAQHFLIDTNSGTGLVICGEPQAISQETDFPAGEESLLQLEFESVVEIPTNSFLNRSIQVGKSEPRFSDGHRISEFTAAGMTFLVDREDGIIKVEIRSSHGGFPREVESRICESLAFLTAQSFYYQKAVRYEAGHERTELRRIISSGPAPHLSRPLAIEGDHINPAAWVLFDAFLTHVIKFEGERYHPISSWLHYVREASRGSIFAKGLALGVAIEGILKAEFSSLGKDNKTFQDEIALALILIDSKEWSETFNNRVRGFFNSLGEVRAKDKLHRLRELGYISQHQIKAWSDLRNAAAHATPPEDGAYQTWVDDCFAVEVLLYNLIFAAIGYRGEYTDYADGFSKKVYTVPIARPDIAE